VGMGGLMTDLSKDELKMALDNTDLVPRLQAQVVERFDAQQLAAVLEQEIARAMAHKLSHVSLNMNLADCRALARALRTAAIAGH
jgi:hypothetical protein